MTEKQTMIAAQNAEAIERLRIENLIKEKVTEYPIFYKEHSIDDVNGEDCSYAMIISKSEGIYVYGATIQHYKYNENLLEESRGHLLTNFIDPDESEVVEEILQEDFNKEFLKAIHKVSIIALT